MKIKLSILFLTILTSLKLSAQTTNVEEEVSKALIKYGQVDVTVIKFRPAPEDMPIDAKNPKKKPAIRYKFKTKQYLTASNIKTLNFREPVFGTAKVTEFPNRVMEKSAICSNPSTVPATCQQTLSLTFQRSSTLSFQETVQKTSSASTNFKFSIIPSVFDIGGTIQVGQSATTGTTTSDANSLSVQSTTSQTVNVPSGKAILLSLRVYTIQHEVPFTCEVIVDANLSTNDKGYKYLSEILSEKDRTFTVKGNLIANDCSSAKVIQSDTELDKDQISALTTTNAALKKAVQKKIIKKKKSSI